MKKRIAGLERLIVERRNQSKPSVIIVENEQEAKERAGEVRKGGTIIIENLEIMRAYVKRRQERKRG